MKLLHHCGDHLLIVVSSTVPSILLGMVSDTSCSGSETNKREQNSEKMIHLSYLHEERGRILNTRLTVVSESVNLYH
jgi:hypothetical protein